MTLFKCWPTRVSCLPVAAFALVLLVGQFGEARAQGMATLSVDDSPAAEEMLHYAGSLREQERFSDAAETYQQVMTRYGQRLRMVEKGLYTDIRHWVQQQIEQDEQLLSAYRRRFEADASRMLAEASKPEPPKGKGRPAFVTTEPALGLPASVQEVDRVSLQDVLDQYYLCDAGFEAGLRLAASQLESGQPEQAAMALDVLRDHPKLAEQRDRWLLLQSAVGLFGDDRTRLGWAFNELREMRATNAVAQLQQWAKGMIRPQRAGAITPIAPWLEADLPSPIGAPLWQVPVPAPDQAIGPDALEQTWDNTLLTAQAGNSMHVVPVAIGDQLFVHLGSAVACLNRSSGQKQWLYQPASQQGDDLQMLNMISRGTSLRFDPRGVATDGKSVVAVLGGLPRGQIRRRMRNESTMLVSLHADDGSVRWAAEPSELDVSLSNTFFHGTPILSGGRLYVMARRQQGAGVHDAAFIVAVDAQSGTLLWRRHLSSLLTQGNSAAVTLAEASLSSNGLFVIDQLGAVASIDPRSGGVNWLRLLEEPQAGSGYPNRNDDQVTSPGKPVLVEAGVVFNQRHGRGDAGGVYLINAQDGQVLKQLNGQPWSNVSMIVEAPGGLIAVGPTIHKIDGETLASKWMLDLKEEVDADEIRGQPALTADHLLLTAGGQFLAINLETGKVESKSPIDEMGNIIAMPEQVVIASEAAIRGYMNWERALAHLDRAINERPLDPSPALALVHVAISVDQPDAALQAADDALLALRRLETASAADGKTNFAVLRQNVFDRLMSFAQTASASDEIRQAMFDRAGIAAVSPSDQVSYRLSYGRFLEHAKRYNAAVEQYQLVVQNPNLQGETYKRDNVRRQAGLEARLRLVHMVHEHGGDVYDEYEMQARQQVDRLADEGDVEVDQMVRIAEQFPVAQAAGDVLMMAADQLEAQGHIHASQMRLRQAYSQMVEPGVLARVSGNLVSSYQRHGRVDRAKRWLVRLQREHPGLKPVRNGQPVDAQTWVDELATAESINPGRPTFYPPLSQPTILSGRLLLPSSQPRSSWPHDRLAMLAGNSFQLRSGDDLELTWEYDVTGHTPELMLLSRTQVLLWLVDSAEIVALNGETGELQWGPVAIPALLDRIGDEDDREAQRHEAERDFLKMTDNRPLRPELRRRILGGRGDAQANEEEAGNWPDTLPGRLVIKQVNDAVICVGDPLGRVAAINRRTGELLWDRLTPMDELDWIALSDEAVALAGKEGLKTDAPAGQILVLDPITGEERIADIHETSVLRWVGMDDEGMLVYATRDQLVAHQIGSGEAWRLAPQNADMADRGWIGLGVVMITAMLDEQQTNLALLIVDSNTGALLSNWTLVTPLDQQSPTMLEPADRNWHVIQRHRASAFGPQGKLQWADAINEPGKQLMMQLLGDRISVLLSSNRLADMQNRVGDAVRLGEPVDPRTMQIYMLDIESGALIAQRQLGPVPDPIDTSRALLLDNRLVLATLSEIVVIKGSADPPADLDRAPAGQKLN